jgi:hypothetical protein
MGKYYGIKLYGKLEPCFSCSLAKIKQKNVRKVAVNPSTVPGERLLVDISLVSARSIGGAWFWVLVMDDYTGMCWSFFVPVKAKMPDQVIFLIKKLQSEQRFKIKHIVKTIRCDDEGENKMLERKCTEAQLGIHFKCTGPGTPQFNGRVERKFIQNMLNVARLPKFLHEGVWAECAKRATDIENMLVTPNKLVDFIVSPTEK